MLFDSRLTVFNQAFKNGPSQNSQNSQNRTEQNRTEQNRTEQNRTEQNRQNCQNCQISHKTVILVTRRLTEVCFFRKKSQMNSLFVLYYI
jgi:hypothetical protein